MCRPSGAKIALGRPFSSIAETAVGSYPVEAVRTMAGLALEAEASLAEYGYLQKINPEPAHVVTEAVAQAVLNAVTLPRTAEITEIRMRPMQKT